MRLVRRLTSLRTLTGRGSLCKFHECCRYKLACSRSLLCSCMQTEHFLCSLIRSRFLSIFTQLEDKKKGAAQETINFLPTTPPVPFNYGYSFTSPNKFEQPSKILI